MRKPLRLLAMALASLCAGLSVPLMALENLELRLMPDTMAFGTGFGAEGAVAPGSAPDRLDTWTLVMADPLAMPLIIVGGLALVAAISLRRHRRRRIGWGYIPTAAWAQRLLAKRH